MKDYIKRIKNLDKKMRSIYLLNITLCGNIFLAILKFIFAFTIPSLWFFINAWFLTILSLSRFFAIKNYQKQKKVNNKLLIGYKTYLNNGILLIILGIMYFFISVYMFYKGTNTTMHEYLTYLTALIAFWSVGWSIYGIIKYNKKTEPILLSAKMTNFANALTSIVLTQVVLLDTFSGRSDLQKVNGLTGMGVSVIIMIMGIYMIINISEQLKLLHT